MLKALDKHVCSLCRNPAEGRVPECFVTGKICCVCSSERQGWELPKASRGLGIIPGCSCFLLEGCDSTAVPGALPIHPGLEQSSRAVPAPIPALPAPHAHPCKHKARFHVSVQLWQCGSSSLAMESNRQLSQAFLGKAVRMIRERMRNNSSLNLLPLLL